MSIVSPLFSPPPFGVRSLPGAGLAQNRPIKPIQPLRQDEVQFAGKPFPGRKLGLTVEQARLKDVDEICSFVEKIDEEEYGLSHSPEEAAHARRYFVSAIKARNQGRAASHIYVIRDVQGRIVGTSAFHQYPVVKEQALFHSTYLAKECRGQGIGGWLMDQRIKRARAAGVKFIRLNAHPPTIPIAQKRGFRITGKPGEKPVPMQLDL